MSDQIPYSPPPSDEAPALTTLQKADLIRGVGIFSELKVEELYRLASIAKVVGFPADAILFRQNDSAQAFYIVVRGQVGLLSQGSEDREVAGPEQAVGLHSVLTQEPCAARATALEDTVAIAVGAEDFYSLLSNNTEIVASIFKSMIRKLEHGTQS